MNFALNFTFNYQQDILQVSARIEQNVNFQEQLSRARSHLHLLFPEQFILKKCSTKPPQRPIFPFETHHLEGFNSW